MNWNNEFASVAKQSCERQSPNFIGRASLFSLSSQISPSTWGLCFYLELVVNIDNRSIMRLPRIEKNDARKALLRYFIVLVFYHRNG